MQPDEGSPDRGIEVRISLGRKEALEFLRQLARDDEFRRRLGSDIGGGDGDAADPDALTRSFASAAEVIPSKSAARMVTLRDEYLAELQAAIATLEADEPNAADRLREWSRSFARVLGGPDAGDGVARRRAARGQLTRGWRASGARGTCSSTSRTDTSSTSGRSSAAPSSSPRRARTSSR